MFDNQKINSIKEKLAAAGQTIAAAESVTAGLLQAALASAEEAAAVFQGGLTAYNIGQKCRHLDINPIHAQACNCVSEQMAQDMALSICRLFTSDWGIGMTGYATPVPESENAVFAFGAIAFKGEILHISKMDAGERLGLDAQVHYVNAILAELDNLVDATAH